MSRDKQMINDLIEIFDEEYGKRNLITPQNTAEKLTAKGYRKVDSVTFMGGIVEQMRADVAEEIFAEIEKSIADIEYRQYTPNPVTVEDLKNQANWLLHEVVPKTLAELKKKYTEVAERREVSENNTVRCFHPSVTESQREAERRKGVENSPVDCSTPSVTDQKGEGK